MEKPTIEFAQSNLTIPGYDEGECGYRLPAAFSRQHSLPRMYLHVSTPCGLTPRRYLTAFGLYIVTEPKLFDILKEIRTHTAANHTVQLTPALDQLRQDYGITGHVLQARSSAQDSNSELSCWRSEHHVLLARASATTSAARRRRTLRRIVCGLQTDGPSVVPCAALGHTLWAAVSAEPHASVPCLHPHRLNAFAHSGTPLGQLKEHQAEPALKRPRK